MNAKVMAAEQQLPRAMAVLFLSSGCCPFVANLGDQPMSTGPRKARDF